MKYEDVDLGGTHVEYAVVKEVESALGVKFMATSITITKGTVVAEGPYLDPSTGSVELDADGQPVMWRWTRTVGNTLGDAIDTA